MSGTKFKEVEASCGLTRRKVLSAALLGVATPAALFAATEAVKPLVPLDPNDPQAKALGYVTDTSKVDPKANATHKPEQHCGNCLQYKGKAGDKQGGCNIFPGKAVVATGWCKVWMAKPAA